MNFLEAKAALLNGTTSCCQLVEEALDRIQGGEHYNAFVSLMTDRARTRAEAIDARLRNNSAGSLAGMVMGIKDVICVKDHPTTCSSRILHGFTPPYDATVIERLEAADAICIGKTNCDEFAMGSTNENSWYGPVLNPHDPERVPGGSSGGSAAAVGAKMVPAALGSDTGGSIRQPAGFCGVVGLKPTYGRVSRYGLVAYASSLDQIGPISSTVEESAQILQVIAGHDERDSTSAPLPVPDYCAELQQDMQKLRIGIPSEYCGEGLDDEIRAKLTTLMVSLQAKNMRVEEMSLPYSTYGVATYYIIAPAEASSNLSRYEGVRYGYRAEEVQELQEMYFKSRTEGFGPEVKRRIMLGTYVLSSGYYDAYYRKAQKVRRKIKEDFDAAFEDYDVLITPIAPTIAFQLGEKTVSPLQMYLSDVYTLPANLAGIPGLTIPYGMSSDGMPIGYQLLAKHYNESILFQLGNFILSDCQ